MKSGFQRAPLPLLLLAVVLLSFTAQATLYQVGPTRAKKTIAAVVNLLNPGDVVEVDGDVTYTNWTSFLRDGTLASPITIRGVRVNGHRPIISGAGLGAIHGLVAFRGDHYVFEGFELDGNTNLNIDRGLYQVGDDIVIRDTLVHHFAYNGIHGSDSAGSLTLDKVEVHHCGSGQSYHQIYVASDNVTHSNAVFRMQFCYVHDGNGGNNVKSRVGRSEIYYNWIESADYHELDLIGADPTAQATNTAEFVREDADVVGNIIVKSPTSRGVIARLGDDATGSSNGRYRFVNNTILLPANYDTFVLRVRGPRESVELHNNVFARVGGGALAFVDSTNPGLSGDHRISGANNWLPTGTAGIPSGLTNTLSNLNPRFTDAATLAFTPTNASPLLDAGQLPTTSPVNFPFPNPLAAPLFLPPLRAPLENAVPIPRPSDGALDIGALEAPPLPPEILTQPTDVTRLQGQTAAFTVTAGGSLTNLHPLTYQWSLDGTPIPGTTNRTLTLTAAQTNDVGNYSVIVTNDFGSATSDNARLTVNPDTSKPSVTINAPPDQTIFTDDLITLSGTAGDNARVNGIFVSVGDTNNWQPVAIINQPTAISANWTNQLALSVGTNKVFVKSVDFAGTDSAIVSRSFFLSVRSPLTLQRIGSGSISSTATSSGTPTDGALLEVTKTFLVTAMPDANWLFSNWLAAASGEPLHEVSTMARYPFAMQTNLTLVAQFVTNQFVGAAGTYFGLFSDPAHAVSHQSAGFIKVTTDSRQRFHGTLTVGGEAVAISGRFNLAGDGSAAQPVTFRSRNDTLTLRLHLSFDGSDTLSGSVSNNDGSWVSPLLANRAVFSTANPATNFAGLYTLVIPGATNATTAPDGDGYGTVKITAKGSLTLAGRLGDGTLLKQSVPISKNGDWPLYCPAYPATAGALRLNTGMIMGWLSVSNGLSGSLVWLKNPLGSDAFYPDGFTREADILGSPYTAPSTGNRVIELDGGSGLLLLSGGNLSQTLSNSVSLSTLNKFATNTSNGLVLKVAAKTGLLSGSFLHPDNAAAVTLLYGAVLQNANSGRGLFKGTNQTGSLRLEGN